MSKPIDDQVVATLRAWVAPPASFSDVVDCNPLSSPLQVPALHSHSYSPPTYSAGSVVPSSSAPHSQIVASTHSATSHIPSAYYREPTATLSGSSLSDAVRSFRCWWRWSTHNHPGSSVPGTEPAVKAPSSSPCVAGGSDGKMLDVGHDNHSANSRAAPFAPGHKELASLAIRFKAERSRGAALLKQSGCQNDCVDPGASVGSECHFGTGGADAASKRVCGLGF
ncbi:uncharacterized protein EI90DRAFT_3035585 [Cantharellus anzutake]|uniref:uncharacterized protein n=1 Tax=Cantharellus anzutake TaxID=1750568 RepID=UPI00190492E2|nr:uncharacterized protein EI90DRAFT_3035585 [Cantharellus anzutake]KAF8340453.1 hypothetical protein EI90DRAFT_3035585 [Cantharellus anzutake]